MKKILYLIIVVTICVAAPSCSKKDSTIEKKHDRVSDYAVFVGASNRTGTSVQLNVQLKNISQIYEAHLYAKDNVYQYTLQWDDSPQPVTDTFIQPSDNQRQYYFKIILTNNEVITGNPFTVKF